MTKQLYYEDPYLRDFVAQVGEVFADGPGKWKILLSQTAFFPVGGGQATDQGILQGEGWKGDVYQVVSQAGEIFHCVRSIAPPPKGAPLCGSIDWARRYRQMRSHSAGHIIDFALCEMGIVPSQLVPQQADHRKKPFILYRGRAPITKEQLQQQVDRLVECDLPLHSYPAQGNEWKTRVLYVQPGLPVDKPIRLLECEGIGIVPDGGTQVRSTGECRGIQITSWAEIEECLRIEYALKGE